MQPFNPMQGGLRPFPNAGSGFGPQEHYAPPPGGFAPPPPQVPPAQAQGMSDRASGIMGTANLAPPGPESAITDDFASEMGNALLQGQSAQAPTDGGGIGLMGTLGIVNLGAGIGSQIFSHLTRPKPKRPRVNIPGGSNQMRSNMM